MRISNPFCHDPTLDPSARQVWVAFLAYASIHAAVFAHFGPQFVDDAYITFRYAERIVVGMGFTFNDGQAVLGSTTPLWTIGLAACREAGIPLAVAVGILNSLAAAALCVALWRLLDRFGPWVFASGKPHLWAVPAWTAAYCLGLAASRIMLFEWYLAPLAAAVWVLALVGLGTLLDALTAGLARAGKRPFGLAPVHLATLLQIGLLCAIVAQSAGFWTRNWRQFPADLTAKERFYLSVAGFFDQRLPHGTRVLLGEAGVLGYGLPRCEILDSAGINSPRIWALRRAEGPGAVESKTDLPPRWVLTTLAEIRPDLVITLPQFVGGAQLAAHPQLAPDYAPFPPPPGVDWGSLVVLRRKGFAPGL